MQHYEFFFEALFMDLGALMVYLGKNEWYSSLEFHYYGLKKDHEGNLRLISFVGKNVKHTSWTILKYKSMASLLIIFGTILTLYLRSQRLGYCTYIPLSCYIESNRFEL